MPDTTEVDVVVVGAGFAGLYMLHRLREHGFSAVGYERADGVGGTWFWNRYPGARCDVESVEYSYKFSEELQQEWEWSERYATQPEILSYAEHVADRFDLRRDIQFSTTVTSAIFDEETNRWTVATDSPDGSQTTTATFVVMATGCLSSANKPNFPGVQDFQGEIYHTSTWPHEGVDFTGKRVGIIGTGSSAIQTIPVIASDCESLTVFQRTANFTIPAHNRPLGPGEQEAVKANYKQLREDNEEMSAGFGSRYPKNDAPTLDSTPEQNQTDYEQRWTNGGLSFLGAYNDAMLVTEANVVASDFVNAKLRAIVENPATADLLTPHQVIGCKRLCVDTGYWETFNRNNVKLVDVSGTGIERLTTTGVQTGGTEYEFDCLIFATGFDAMTGALIGAGIVGRNAEPLSEAWDAGPVNYLGLGVAGFPNLFTITGPGSPSVLTNMLTSIQQHVEWISDAFVSMRELDHQVMEVTPAAQEAWVGHVNGVADMTLFPTCNSWYLGANVPGKPRIFMPLPGYPDYKAKCEQVAADDYEGFVFS